MTTFDDRMLLELAAKAAGFEIRHGLNDWTQRLDTNDDWNPLKSGTDALDLAVKLKITIVFEFSKHLEVAWWNGKGEYVGIVEEFNDSPYAATRRAIVRAAAEIGTSVSIGENL